MEIFELKLLEAARTAGHKLAMPHGAGDISDEWKQKYLSFGTAVANEIKGGLDVTAVDLEWFRKQASIFCGYEPYTPDWNNPGAIFDVQRSITSEGEGMFYTRFAYDIAAMLRSAN